MDDSELNSIKTRSKCNKYSSNNNILKVKIFKNLLTEFLHKETKQKMDNEKYIKYIDKMIKKKDSIFQKKFSEYSDNNFESSEIEYNYLSLDILNNIYDNIQKSKNIKFNIITYIANQIETYENNENVKCHIKKKRKNNSINNDDNNNDNNNDVDEYGNISGLIDYDYDSDNYELNKSDSDSDVLTDTNDEESENSFSEDELYDNLEPESNLKDPEEEMEINTNETIDFIIDKLKLNRKNLTQDDRKFIKILYDLDKTDDTHDIYYFCKLSNEEKQQKLNLLNEINNINNKQSSLFFRVINSQMPNIVKADVYKKISMCKECPESNFKLKSWTDSIMEIPFGVYYNDPIDKKDGKKKIKNYFKNAQITLDKAVYGHKNAKNKILQIIAQSISNPKSTGSVIGIQGPMGNGKTTLVEKGICKALNRPFAYISLGGATDASYLEGHSYTYEGSTHGKIIEILKKTKCMNPVIYFDELDKVSDTDRGEEIINLLIHLIDPSQNTHYNDKYFAGIDFDLSKALFIFSYNDSDDINPILIDRITEVNTKGFKLHDKIKIANNYLLPNIFEEMGLQINDIEFNTEILKYIIDKFTIEGGVRKMKELLYEIVREINLRYLDCKKLDNKDITFPINITKEIIDEDLFVFQNKISKQVIHKSPKIGKVNGLYASSCEGLGGITIIEAVEMPSDSKLQLELTGSQGDVMKESMSVARSVSWNLINNETKSDYTEKWKNSGNTGFHIHCPEAATPKDGPSAGGAIVLCIVSRLINSEINHEIALTGEVDLSGNITAIGGLENKLFGAKQAGVKKVIIPRENKLDYEKIIKNNDDLLDKNFEIVMVENIFDILDIVFPDYEFNKF